MWARKAKQCTEFLEGKQWTDEQIAIMHEIKRSALTINKINPLFRLIMGYQSSNRMDVTYNPTSDSASREDIGELLTHLYKIEADRMDLKYTDSEVFADGITTGRGYWDSRLCFMENDFGDLKTTTKDPFSILVDPDASSYDLCNTAAYIQESVWTDADSIAAKFGSWAAEAVENMTSNGYTSQLLTYLGDEEKSPERFFGQYADDKSMNNWSDVYHTDFVDHQAKRIKLLDTQYKVITLTDCFIDLETGAREAIPNEWLKPENHYKIEAAMQHAEQIGNRMDIAKRPVSKVRWTVSCGDILLHDDWSPYSDYTITGYFPYFRRGKTRGFVEDLIDPQMEMNKKRSVLTDILNRNANSGWIYEENSLDPDQEENLRKYGSAPGINVKWKRTQKSADKPARIEPGGYPQGLDRLEQKAAEDLNVISGINESALGQLDTVQSGRAIEARQRQAVLSIQLYTDNFGRSKKIQGKKFLDIFQKHYTEERAYSTIGEDSKAVMYEINKKEQTGVNSFTRLNDITIGKYGVNVDETPISATFKQGQFEETMMLLEKLGPVGQALIETNPDLIIDQTSLPRKDDWKKGLMEATSQAAMAAGNPEAGGGAPVMTGTPEQFAS